MDLKNISELIKMVSESNLTALEIEENDFKIKLEKGTPVKVAETVKAGNITTHNVAVESHAVNVQKQEAQVEEAVQKVAEKFEGTIIKSPMVGSFYSASSPESEPFISVGKKVKKGDTICIIEAMKLMNEIESEFDGEVVEILVKDGDLVEYGQPLFKII